MALRTRLGCLSGALLLCALVACGKDSKATSALDERCDQLAKVCGDKTKHIDKMLEECKAAAAKQVEKNCKDKAIAAYDCYERELCGTTEKVWTVDDFRVLADRHKKCIAERDALAACVK